MESTENAQKAAEQDPTEFDAKSLIQKILDSEINKDTEDLRKSTKMGGISQALKSGKDSNLPVGHSEPDLTDKAFDSKLDELLNFEKMGKVESGTSDATDTGCFRDIVSQLESKYAGEWTGGGTKADGHGGKRGEPDLRLS